MRAVKAPAVVAANGADARKQAVVAGRRCCSDHSNPGRASGLDINLETRTWLFAWRSDAKSGTLAKTHSVARNLRCDGYFSLPLISNRVPSQDAV